MTVSALLSPDRIFIDTDISSKKRLLEFIAKTVASQFGLSQPALYNNLLNRERLGSTGLGKGFAIPHTRMLNLDTTIACFIRLDQPIKFEAPDNEPVDLVFSIIIPENATDEHLQILSSLAKIFSQSEVCDAIRKAGSGEEVANIIDSAEQ
jgi:PTS system nitrogen regulatory IIA component